MSGTIQEKGILITAIVHMWSGKAKVREVGATVEQEYKMQTGRADPGVWLVEPMWFRRPMHTANLLRAVVRRYCLRFGKGWLLPTTLHKRFHDEWRLVLSAHKAEVRRFLREYPRLRTEGITALGTLQDADQLYPSDENLKSMFEVELQEAPVADPSTWQPRLDSETIEHLKIDFDNMLGEQVKDAVVSMMHKMQGFVKHMATTLQDPDKNKFHKTLVGNVCELVEMMPDFNLTDDPAIDEIIEDIRKSLFIGSTKELKDDLNLRAQAAAEAQRIAAKMEGIFGKPKTDETETAL